MRHELNIVRREMESFPSTFGAGDLIRLDCLHGSRVVAAGRRGAHLAMKPQSPKRAANPKPQTAESGIAKRSWFALTSQAASAGTRSTAAIPMKSLNARITMNGRVKT